MEAFIFTVANEDYKWVITYIRIGYWGNITNALSVWWFSASTRLIWGTWAAPWMCTWITSLLLLIWTLPQQEKSLWVAVMTRPSASSPLKRYLPVWWWWYVVCSLLMQFLAWLFRGGQEMCITQNECRGWLVCLGRWTTNTSFVGLMKWTFDSGKQEPLKNWAWWVFVFKLYGGTHFSHAWCFHSFSWAVERRMPWIMKQGWRRSLDPIHKWSGSSAIDMSQGTSTMASRSCRSSSIHESAGVSSFWSLFSYGRIADGMQSLFFHREANRRAHSKPGSVPHVPEKAKAVLTEQSWWPDWFCHADQSPPWHESAFSLCMVFNKARNWLFL